MSTFLARFSRASTAYDNSSLDWYNFPGLGQKRSHKVPREVPL